MKTENQVTGAAGDDVVAIAEGFIDKPEMARRSKKSVRTIDNWMARGLIPFYRVGRSVLFKWSDVEAHLAANYRVCRRTITK